VTQQLQSLLSEYQRERLSRMAAYIGVHKPGLSGCCRYCGERWLRVEGSTLDGHAKCIVGPEFKSLVDDLLSDAGITQRMVADTLGVTVAVVRSWIRTKGARS
jgi:hypothetical protein